MKQLRNNSWKNKSFRWNLIKNLIVLTIILFTINYMRNL